jgi:hypothetical protein
MFLIKRESSSFTEKKSKIIYGNRMSLMSFYHKLIIVILAKQQE